MCDCVCLPTVCEYCSTGDLYTYWILKGQFGDDEARVFAAELGCALGECPSSVYAQYSSAKCV